MENENGEEMTKEVFELIDFFKNKKIPVSKAVAVMEAVKYIIFSNSNITLSSQDKTDLKVR